MAALISALRKRTPDEIKSFQNHLTNAMFDMDTKAHYQGSGDPGGDGFIYVRGYALASGREFYEAALANPTKMPNEFAWCESILYVAQKAWAKATGDEEWNFDQGYIEKSYETHSNPAFDLT